MKVFDWLFYFIFKQMAILGAGSDPDITETFN